MCGCLLKDENGVSERFESDFAIKLLKHCGTIIACFCNCLQLDNFVISSNCSSTFFCRNLSAQKWITMVTICTLLHHSYPFKQNPTTVPINLHNYDYNDTESENVTATNLDVKIAKENSDPFGEIESEFPSNFGNTTQENIAGFKLAQRDIDEALQYGLKAAEELHKIKEPLWYSMGEWQEDD